MTIRREGRAPVPGRKPDVAVALSGRRCPPPAARAFGLAAVLGACSGGGAVQPRCATDVCIRPERVVLDPGDSLRVTLIPREGATILAMQFWGGGGLATYDYETRPVFVNDNGGGVVAGVPGRGELAGSVTLTDGGGGNVYAPVVVRGVYLPEVPDTVRVYSNPVDSAYAVVLPRPRVVDVDSVSQEVRWDVRDPSVARVTNAGVVLPGRVGLTELAVRSAAAPRLRPYVATLVVQRCAQWRYFPRSYTATCTQNE